MSPLTDKLKADVAGARDYHQIDTFYYEKNAKAPSSQHRSRATLLTTLDTALTVIDALVVEHDRAEKVRMRIFDADLYSLLGAMDKAQAAIDAALEKKE